MSSTPQWDLIPEEDYLREELLTHQKNEYVGGVIHPLPGSGSYHDAVAKNLMGSLKTLLRGTPWKPCHPNNRVRLRLSSGTRYYYPDAMVVLRPHPDRDAFQDQPTAIIEVLSDSTRRTDAEEKKDAYLAIPSLSLYVIVEPEVPLAVAFRRTSTGFARSVIAGWDQALPMPEFGVALPLAELYEGIRLEA